MWVHWVVKEDVKGGRTQPVAVVRRIEHVEAEVRPMNGTCGPVGVPWYGAIDMSGSGAVKQPLLVAAARRRSRRQRRSQSQNQNDDAVRAGSLLSGV